MLCVMGCSIGSGDGGLACILVCFGDLECGMRLDGG